MLFDIHTHLFDKNHACLQDVGLKIPLEGFFSVGIHPWKAESVHPEEYTKLKELSMHPNCVAIGEAGLDKLIGSSFEIQRKTFIEQALLAEELKLPLIIHCVKAWNELREIKRKLKPNIPWIYHGFNKTSLVDEVIEEGFYLSFGHSLLTNVSLQKRIDNVPLDRIFLETDNANVDLKLLYQCLAEIKDLTLPELEKAIEINVLNIFPKWRIGLAELNY